MLKVINDDLLVGRVYLGSYPHGVRILTFAMSRRYGFERMTVDDHAALFAAGSAPSPRDLEGVWRMDAISNANHAGGIAYLQFSNKPDGRFEARYQLMGLMEGLVTPSFLKDHFQLNDFTLFHDEIRKVAPDYMAGKYITGLPPAAAVLPGGPSLGLLQTGPGGEFGFRYTLTRAEGRELPTNTLLKPFLDAQLPDGVGLTFDETMTGWYFPGQGTPSPGRAGDLSIGDRIPVSGDPAGGAVCRFTARMTVADLNAFIDGYDHEAGIDGNISFSRFEGEEAPAFAIDSAKSRFRYLRLNAATGEAEMQYRIAFTGPTGRRFALEGVKYMQKDDAGVFRSIREILQDYTTLYCHVYELFPDGSTHETGTAWLKFRTFEDLAAAGNLAGFLASFQVTGTGDPFMQLQARMRFVAFTARFVQREYDPLGFGGGLLEQDVRQEVLRGATTPDYFSTRSTADLQAILRDTPTLDLARLVNTGEVRVDFDQRRIFRDCFWKGSFARDSLLGWEQRVRAALLGADAETGARTFAGGSFWKRFDKVENGVAAGYVVNYEMAALPGLPEVHTVPYPDDNRRYFKKGDPVLLLTYTNDPYRMVYDTIKIIDEQNAIGVMHLGAFPNGVEFATFVMARQNYPFENMSVEDHDAVFAGPNTSVPSPAQLEGAWQGRLIFLNTPDTSLLNQVSPVILEGSFQSRGAQADARYRIGLLSREAAAEATADLVMVRDATGLQAEIRMIDAETLIGRCVAPELDPVLAAVVRHCAEPRGGRFLLRFILKRTA